jgi:DNA-binding CsgD family transcriptional regulator
VTRADVLGAVFEASGLGLAILRLDLRIADTNDAFLAHFGGTKGQRTGESFLDLLHPATRELTSRLFQKLLTANRRHFTERMVGLGAKDRPISGKMTGTIVHDRAGRMGAIAVQVAPDGLLGGASAPAGGLSLTDLDARIVEGVAAGASTVLLADRLHLSRQGVEYRIAALLRRFQAPNRTALVARAYAMGALTVGGWPPKVLPELVV